MAKQRFTAEEIIHKLREADVLIGQGKSIGDASSQYGRYGYRMITGLLGQEGRSFCSWRRYLEGSE